MRVPRFIPFTEAHAFAKSLELAGQKEWQEWCRTGARPRNIPAAPDKHYKKGDWQGFAHWLGTKGLSPAELKARANKTT